MDHHMEDGKEGLTASNVHEDCPADKEKS